MKTNRINAPLTYKETAPALNPRLTAPELKKELDAKRRPRREEPPRVIRVYTCAHCRQPGDTLKNVGTHREPFYVHHPPCPAMKDIEKKAAGGKTN